jgi:hypothetical protein
MDALDYIMKKVFMNFFVEGKKVVNITQNSPFRELCESPFGVGRPFTKPVEPFAYGNETLGAGASEFVDDPYCLDVSSVRDIFGYIVTEFHS